MCQNAGNSPEYQPPQTHVINYYYFSPYSGDIGRGCGLCYCLQYNFGDCKIWSDTQVQIQIIQRD